METNYYILYYLLAYILHSLLIMYIKMTKKLSITDLVLAYKLLEVGC